MPIVHPCAAPDCAVLTMGDYCVQHEPLQAANRRRRLAAGAALLLFAGAAALARHLGR